MAYKKVEELMGLVYPTDSAREFLCNDFFQELLEIIPQSLCINSFNTVKKVRLKNLTIVKRKITGFLLQHTQYQEEIMRIYRCEKIDKYIINRFVVGYVFFIAKTTEKFKDIDIIKDKRSICYYDIDMLALLTR